jgi:hypothetical protein
MAHDMIDTTRREILWKAVTKLREQTKVYQKAQSDAKRALRELTADAGANFLELVKTREEEKAAAELAEAELAEARKIGGVKF